MQSEHMKENIKNGCSAAEEERRDPNSGGDCEDTCEAIGGMPVC